MKADAIVDPRAVVVHFKGTSLTYRTVVRPVLNHEAQGFPILKTDLSGLIARHFSQYLTAFWTLLCLTRQSSCSAKVESKAFHSSSDWADRSLSTWNRLDLLRTLNQDMKKIMYWSIPMFHLIRAEMPWERCEAWRCEYYHGVGPDEQGGQAVEYDSTDHLKWSVSRDDDGNGDLLGWWRSHCVEYYSNKVRIVRPRNNTEEKYVSFVDTVQHSFAINWLW